MDTGITIPMNRTVGVDEVVVPWAIMKSFFNATKGCFLSYMDLGDRYYIWLCFRDQKFYTPQMMKNIGEARNPDAVEFEASYKSKCNIEEYPRIRTTTNRAGRKFHARYFTVTTASKSNDPFDNTDWTKQSYGDVTCHMMKYVNGVPTITEVDAEADVTYFDFEPTYNYELIRGSIDVPPSLGSVETEDIYELHCIAAPDVPVSMGGSHPFISNPHLKWKKSVCFGADSAMNPAEFTYSATYHTNKLRFYFIHPTGEKCDFQIAIELYK